MSSRLGGEWKWLAARIRPLLPSLALAAHSLVLGLVGLLAAEAVLRVSAPDYLVAKRGFLVFSETYGWASRSRTSVTVNGSRYTFNSRGYRGRELAVPRTDKERRVVVLGDSVAFGLGVSDEQTFAHLLDARDDGIEVANLSVQGYGPGQELLVLEHEGLPLDPDVVVLAVCLSNDLADAALGVSLYDGRPAPRFELVGDQLSLDTSGLRQSPARRTLQSLSDYSHLFNRLSELTRPREAALDTHWHARYAEALRDEDRALRLGVALVLRMRDLCRSQAARLLVVAFPDRSFFRSQTPLSERFLESLRAEGLSVIDMADRFRDNGLRFGQVALDGTGHLNAAGHDLTAEVLEAEIASRVRD